MRAGNLREAATQEMTMLVRLTGRNFRSFRDDFELSMVAADLTRAEDRDRGVIRLPLAGSDEPLVLLRVVGIYGHNGAGKSSVLLAADALRWLVESSSRFAKPGGPVGTYDPFRLDAEVRDAAVGLGCDVMFGDQILRYSLKYSRREIDSESLSLHTADQAVTLLDRRQGLPVGGRLLEQSDANHLYTIEMQPNVSVLSKLAQHGPADGPESVRPYASAIVRSLRYGDYSTHGMTYVFGPDPSRDRFADDANYRRWIMDHLMTAADVGIRDVTVRRRDVAYPDNVRKFMAEGGAVRLPEREVVVTFLHGNDEGSVVRLDDESTGTRKLFNMADDWWQLAHEPGALFADEVGAGLHPRLFDAMIRGVNDAGSNLVRSQLVFATHDTGLMEARDGRPPALRRDQIYLVEKDGTGASHLRSLAEFREDARPVHNLRRRYLSGVYGALPATEVLPL